MRCGEKPLAAELAVRGVVIERPDLVPRAVGEIHGAAVRAEGDAVRHLDAGAERLRRAIRVDAVEHTLRLEIRLFERTDPEAAGAIAAAVVEAQGCDMSARPDQALRRLDAEEVEAALQSDQHPAVA